MKAACTTKGRVRILLKGGDDIHILPMGHVNLPLCAYYQWADNCYSQFLQ